MAIIWELMSKKLSENIRSILCQNGSYDIIHVLFVHIWIHESYQQTKLSQSTLYCLDTDSQ